MLNFSKVFAVLKLSLGLSNSRIVGPSPFIFHSTLFGLKLIWRSRALPIVWQVKLCFQRPCSNLLYFGSYVISTILSIEKPCRKRISDISASGPAKFNLACRLEIRLIIISLARFLKLQILG